MTKNVFESQKIINKKLRFGLILVWAQKKMPIDILRKQILKTSENVTFRANRKMGVTKLELSTHCISLKTQFTK